MSIIKQATGATITAQALLKESLRYDVTAYGAQPGGDPVANTNAINRAILEASQAGGGTVVIPAGDFKCYTIHLQSNVNLYIDKDATIRAARTDIKADKFFATAEQKGEGGNYEEPEVNLYAGVQDGGHTYFANSLIYGVDIENVMIYGDGHLDGSYLDEEGIRHYVLGGGDPPMPEMRTDKGHRGDWFGNKGVALVRCKNVVLKDFDIVIGGHFAIIAEGVVNMLVENMIVDTIRDAFNIDCCQDVTVLDSVFNSLTDDGIVMKASFGAACFMPCRNIVIKRCTVSGYDAGSVYAGKYTCDKLIASDRCGPTARVKFGTEATCGYDTVLIEDVLFDRSRGFAMEATDVSPLHDIIFRNCTMKNVSSSPFFIRVGDRARFPVTGNSEKELVISEATNVRVDTRQWVLPDLPKYLNYPAGRYTPSYKRDAIVNVDGHSGFLIVDGDAPTNLNPANFAQIDGKYYAMKYVPGEGYVPDLTKELSEQELPKYANAVGSADFAAVYNIEISGVKIENCDPRYPILFAGLMDSKIKNVVIKDVSVEFRGGLTMEHAVEQRQLNTNWRYTQYETAPSMQTLPWLVNTFFSKNEALLPRVRWDAEKNTWVDDPFNVPEMVDTYPEPSIFGILPAYGVYARHVDGLAMNNVQITFKVPDGRPAVVLDDVANADFTGFTADVAEGSDKFVFVQNAYKRPTYMEYVKDEPYTATTVENVTLPEGDTAAWAKVNAPAPGTPKDSLYSYPTVATPETGYTFPVATEEYPLPLTVFRPFISHVDDQCAKVGEALSFTISARNPATETEEDLPQRPLPPGVPKALAATMTPFTVRREEAAPMTFACENLPEGASFCADCKTFTWTPNAGQEGEYEVVFTVSDGVIPEKTTVKIVVK